MFTATEGSPFGWMNVASRICYEDPNENNGNGPGSDPNGGSFDMSMSATDPNNSGAFGNGPVDLSGGGDGSSGSSATSGVASTVADVGKIGSAATGVAVATALVMGTPLSPTVVAIAASGFAVMAASPSAINLANAVNAGAASVAVQTGASPTGNPFGPIGVYSTQSGAVDTKSSDVGGIFNAATNDVLPVWTDNAVIPVYGSDVMVAGSGLPPNGGYVYDASSGVPSYEYPNSYYATGGGS